MFTIRKTFRNYQFARFILFRFTAIYPNFMAKSEFFNNNFFANIVIQIEFETNWIA